MTTIQIACCTTDDSGEFSVAWFALIPEFALELVTDYRKAYKRVKRLNEQLYCLEFFMGLGEYGCRLTKNGAMLHLESGGWYDGTDAVMSPGEFRARTACHTMKITSTGVLFSAHAKHGSGEFETEEISWEDLGEIAKGGMPFDAPEGANEDEE